MALGNLARYPPSRLTNISGGKRLDPLSKIDMCCGREVAEQLLPAIASWKLHRIETKRQDDYAWAFMRLRKVDRNFGNTLRIGGCFWLIGQNYAKTGPCRSATGGCNCVHPLNLQLALIGIWIHYIAPITRIDSVGANLNMVQEDYFNFTILRTVSTCAINSQVLVLIGNCSPNERSRA